jgi:hypothetical protein
MGVFVQIMITLFEELSEITSFHHAFENKKLQELGVLMRVNIGFT